MAQGIQMVMRGDFPETLNAILVNNLAPEEPRNP